MVELAASEAVKIFGNQRKAKQRAIDLAINYRAVRYPYS